MDLRVKVGGRGPCRSLQEREQRGGWDWGYEYE